MFDGLTDAFDHIADGPLAPSSTTTRPASRRERQDAFAAASHEKAAAAIKDGRFADEIVPVQVPQRKGDPILVETDEGVRPGTTAESSARCKPAFDQGRHHHRRQRLADLRRRRGRRRDVGGRPRSSASHPSARSWATARWPGPDTSLLTQPSQGDPRRRCAAGGHRRRRPSTSSRSTRRSPPSAWPRWTSSASTTTIVNVNGGAIALGHPVGMSGTRLALDAAARAAPPRRRHGRRALCGGGGQGDAAILRTLDDSQGQPPP